MKSTFDKLKAAVVAQLGGAAEAKRQFPDIARYGISGGFGGFIYYVDTVKFYDKHKTTIKQYLLEEAEDMGCSVAELIRTDDKEEAKDIQKVLHGMKFDGDYYAKNKLAWYAAESVAYRVTNTD